MQIYNGMLKELQESLEANLANVHRLQGGQKALQVAFEDINKLNKIADQELDEKKIPDLQVLSSIKLYIKRALTSLDMNKKNLVNQNYILQGKVQGVEQTMNLVEKKFNSEKNKLQGLLNAIESGEATLDEHGDLIYLDTPEAKEKYAPKEQKVIEMKKTEKKPTKPRKRNVKKQDAPDT